MSSIEELNDLETQAKELQEEQRALEADAFAVMRQRSTYFALKLLLGINHKAKEVIQEAHDEEVTAPTGAELVPA